MKSRATICGAGERLSAMPEGNHWKKYKREESGRSASRIESGESDQSSAGNMPDLYQGALRRRYFWRLRRGYAEARVRKVTQEKF